MVVSPASVPKMTITKRLDAPGSRPASQPPPPKSSSPLPYELLHPTQNAVTSAGQAERRQRSARLALVLAAGAMAAGLAVIGIAVMRGPSAPPPAASATPTGEPAASQAAAAVDPPPMSTASSIAIDLPDPDP